MASRRVPRVDKGTKPHATSTSKMNTFFKAIHSPTVEEDDNSQMPQEEQQDPIPPERESPITKADLKDFPTKADLSSFFQKVNCHQDGWEIINGRYLFFSNIKDTWQNSIFDCVRRGSTLLIHKDNSLQDNLPRNYNYWIGLRYFYQTSSYSWLDGSTETKMRGYYCGLLINGKLHDARCSFQNRWICEKKCCPFVP
ncbi:killer cell lectin-like receptor subfamily B member 1C [Bombina bombina]|uniref:killer cell lectin-like receptor subfamily B member 1C n=1 Tax=Bombina bombina TaxID=8345 RepID=UPI00235A5A76|nr:killer cell lectin-like receptor subfamily B member 1C [Bombina bombina]